ncbi:hypothetical protein FKW77_001593 [Venturia effusa]|uniref:SUN domain-containing protein n=1 Tax=Venturia effusa TaxID=50376 RepID=A0A517LBY4_9PEZI|nr:hypothetical protein FKW77_001593 [Venturia effusa]
MVSPTKVTRQGTRASSRLKAASVSVAGSDVGSVDSIPDPPRNTGVRSRNARAGITGNSYGTAADAKSSQMAAGNSKGLADNMIDQLQEETHRQQRGQALIPQDSGGFNPDPVRSWRQFLPPVREESSDFNTSKSFGPRHEHGMGQTDSRKKSFSIEHEHGIARSIIYGRSVEPIVHSREATPDSLRDSPSYRAESSPGLDVNQLMEDHKKAIWTFFGLVGLLFFGWCYSPLLWENASRLTPDGAIPPAVTVTSHVHAHKTTTITEIIKETSLAAPPASIQERRNFFNMEIGAKIDPSLTSITRAPMNLLYSVLAPLSGKWFPSPIVNQADTALRPWTETGQSWCAASSDLGQGQLQLGISLPFTVRPLAITLEHQLEHLSFDPNNSARHVELWVESHEDSTGANSNNDCGPTPEGLNEFWFCVAKMEFSRFNGEEKSQRIEFRNEHVFTNHFAFRVMDNWGSDHTCLYRVQMHGEMKHKW